MYHFITAGGFPESGSGCAIGSRPSRILLVFVAKEVPIVLWGGSYFASLCRKPNVINTTSVIQLSEEEITSVVLEGDKSIRFLLRI